MLPPNDTVNNPLSKGVLFFIFFILHEIPKLFALLLTKLIPSLSSVFSYLFKSNWLPYLIEKISFNFINLFIFHSKRYIFFYSFNKQIFC